MNFKTVKTTFLLMELSDKRKFITTIKRKNQRKIFKTYGAKAKKIFHVE